MGTVHPHSRRGGRKSVAHALRGVMARHARAEQDSAIYHVTQRGNGGKSIFRTDADRRLFLKQLEITAKRYGWLVLAYCQMTNHYHAVVETTAPTLGDGMRRLGSIHAQAFNRRAATYGHVYQERYGAVLVRTDAQFVQLLRYVVFNPVDAKLCGEPADWKWSSHRLMLAGRGDSVISRARVEELLPVPYAS